ncbi:AMIN domain-containing protein, partial [bacterium]|nr:AMIN domain-containing protein [bacterium]
MNYKYKQLNFKRYPCHCEERSKPIPTQAGKQSLPSVIARSSSSSVIARSETTKQSQEIRLFSIPRRKACLLFFILTLFLLTSFLANASAQNISITNIWYKKLPNYTHLTIKASGAILEYEVSYLEEPERIIIDVKNALYNIDELSKNILFLNMGSVKQVRCGQFESEPIPITRFVIDLFQKTNYE